MIRCKFRCISVKQAVGYIYDGSQNKQVVLDEATFSAVTGGSDENKKFFAATPSGTLTFGTHAHSAFEAGKYYYLDLTEAPE